MVSIPDSKVFVLAMSLFFFFPLLSFPPTSTPDRVTHCPRTEGFPGRGTFSARTEKVRRCWPPTHMDTCAHTQRDLQLVRPTFCCLSQQHPSLHTGPVSPLHICAGWRHPKDGTQQVLWPNARSECSCLLCATDAHSPSASQVLGS